jgi:hypothetical protein
MNTIFQTASAGFLPYESKNERRLPIESLAVCIKAEDFMNLIPRKIRVQSRELRAIGFTARLNGGIDAARNRR